MSYEARKLLSGSENQPRDPDIGSALAKFEDITRLSGRGGLEVGRLDLFVPKDFNRFNDASYQVKGGQPYLNDELHKVNGLPVHVIERELVRP